MIIQEKTSFTVMGQEREKVLVIELDLELHIHRRMVESRERKPCLLLPSLKECWSILLNPNVQNFAMNEEGTQPL